MNPLLLERGNPFTRGEVIQHWLRLAVDASGKERRRYKRHAMFQPIMIKESNGKVISAFSRDISRAGIGMVHHVPLSLAQSEIQLSSPKLELNIKVKQCRRLSAHWHISYGQFVCLSPSNIAKLAVATAADKLNQRLAQRHPFFRPILLKLCSTQETIASVFCRDISSTGIGLFHDVPLDRQQVLLRIADDGVSAQAVLAKICWCKPSANGWYVSGAKFEPLLMEELEY